jgi:kynurenine formamidase
MFARYSRSKVALSMAVIVLAAFSAYYGYSKNLDSTLYYNSAYAQYGAMKSLILSDAARNGLPANDVTVMTRETWDVAEATGLKAVMVPNNDVDTIVLVAQHYNAHYILLPAERPQLDKIYKNTTPDPRFVFVAQVPGTDMKIFWLKY